MKINNEIFSKESNKIKEDLTIASLSDVHINRGMSYQLIDKTIEKVASLKPNYITISGDIIYRAKEYLIQSNREKLVHFFRSLSQITQVIISYGNHDLRDDKNITAGEAHHFLEYLTKIYNLVILDNTNLLTNDINFVGFSQRLDGYNEKYKKKWTKWFYEDYLAANLKIIKDKFNVLLLHSPLPLHDPELVYLLKDYFAEIDLILTGHMHDGLVPKWMQNIGLVTNEYGFNPSFYWMFEPKCRGSFELGDSTLIVNRGLRKWVIDTPLCNLIDQVCAKDITTITLKKVYKK